MSETGSPWNKLDKYGTAKFSFAANGKYQISLNAGDYVKITGEMAGWYKGFVFAEKKSGIFPCNHINALEQPPEDLLAGAESVPTKRKRTNALGSLSEKQGDVDSSEDPIVTEIIQVIKEWSLELRKLTEDGRHAESELIKDKMFQLVSFKKRLMALPSGESTQREDIRQKVIRTIEEGSMLLGLDMIVRVNKGERKGERVDETNCSVLEMYKLFRDAQHKKFQEQLERQQGSELAKDDKKSKRMALKTSTRDSTKLPSDGPVHLLLDFKLCMCPLDSTTELYFGLYSAEESRFVSEEFFVELTSSGLPADPRLMDNMRAIFKDIGRAEVNSSLYLVVRAFKKTVFLNQEKKSLKEKAAGQPINPEDCIRRAFGCSVFPLEASFIAEKLLDKREFSPPEPLPIYACPDEKFHALHEEIISETGQYEKVPKSIGIVLSLRFFTEPLEDVLAERKELRTAAITQMKSLPDIVSPSEMRNELYITLHNGVYVQDMKNVEVNVTLIQRDGRPVMPAIVRSSSRVHAATQRYRSSVFHKVYNAQYNETIRLALDKEEIRNSYVLFTFYHCTTANLVPRQEIIGFSFFRPVEEHNVVARDGEHVLPIYKPSKALDNLSAFITDESARGRLLTRNTFSILINLVSTRYTQNAVLNNLLRWREVEDIDDALNKFTYFQEMRDIMKFLREILDALFSILTTKNNEKAALSVYRSLVRIIGTTVDEKQRQYSPFLSVLDQYISLNADPAERIFRFDGVHTWLLACLKRCLSSLEPSSESSSSGWQDVREAMKSLNYLLKFIVRSRLNWEEKHKPDGGEDDEDREEFRVEVAEVLDAVSNLMKRTTPAWINAAQVLLLKNVSTMFDTLSLVFDSIDLGEIARAFVGSVRKSKDEPGLAKAKLGVLSKLARGETLIQDESRKIVLPTIVDQLKVHVGQSEEERIACVQIIADILDVAQTKMTPQNAESTLSGILTLLPDVVHSLNALYARADSIRAGLRSSLTTTPRRMSVVHLRFASAASDMTTASNFDSVSESRAEDDLRKVEERLAENVLCLLSFCGMMSTSLLVELMEIVKETSGKSDADAAVLLDLLKCCHRIMQSSPISERWEALAMHQYSILLRTFGFVSEVLTERFLAEPSFHQPLWSELLEALLDCVANKNLQLEAFPKSKQDRLTLRRGDLRLDAISRVEKLWATLGDRQSDFLLDLVEPTLRLFLINKPDIQAKAVELYYSMISRELRDLKRTQDTMRPDENRRRVQGKTYDVLDSFLAEGLADVEFKELFVRRLSERFSADEDLREEGQRFLSDVTTLMRLVESVSKYKNEEEEDKTSAALILMKYLKDTQNHFLYFRYVHLLCEMHCSLENYVEAALSLGLHASVLDWSDTLVDASGPYPAQASRVMKETIYEQCAELFEKGKDYERSIRLLKELGHQYEDVQYDYKRLAAVLRKEAELFGKIAFAKRFFASYFRVAYYGHGFAAADLQNKELVYRGKELERLSDFLERIRRRFPNAEFMKPNETPGPDIVHGAGQYIQVNTVVPSSLEEMQGSKAERNGLPLRVWQYRQANDVNVFTYSRTYRKTKDKIANEFKDLWMTNIYLVTADKFPTYHRTSQVIQKKEVELTPLELACNTIEGKNDEIRQLVSSNREEERPDTNKLSMLLNGVIDAAVQGGVYKYKDAFFSEEFITTNATNPGVVRNIQRLQAALAAQLVVLEDGLREFKREISVGEGQGGLLPLQNKLEAFYEKMTQDLKETLELKLT